jgi:hypothetical protein
LKAGWRLRSGICDAQQQQQQRKGTLNGQPGSCNDQQSNKQGRTTAPRRAGTNAAL